MGVTDNHFLEKITILGVIGIFWSQKCPRDTRPRLISSPDSYMVGATWLVIKEKLWLLCPQNFLCTKKKSKVNGFQDITQKPHFGLFFSTTWPKRLGYFFYGTKKFFFCIFVTSNIFLSIKNYWQRWNENPPLIAHSLLKCVLIILSFILMLLDLSFFSNLTRACTKLIV